MNIDRPTDVLDLQVDLARYWERNPYAPAFAQTFIDSMPGRWRGRLDQFLAGSFNTAETVYVQPHIVSRLWQFTDQFDTAEPLSRDDLPFDRGFVYLGSPIYISDVHGRVCSVRGLLWSTIPEGVVVFAMSDRRDPLDELQAILNAEYGDMRHVDSDLPLLHAMPMRYGWDVCRQTPADIALPESAWSVQQVEGDQSARYIDQMTGEQVPEQIIEFARQDTVVITRFIVSLWDFMHDQLPTSHRPGRAQLRRLTRSGLATQEVVVVDMRTQRNESPHYPDPAEVIWSHRWRVRQHVRRWIDREGNHRETTIHSYVKGPDFLPLIEKDRLYHVRR